MAESVSQHPSGSRLVSRILPPAIRFWLRTQVEHVEDLTFTIDGRDRDLLSGHIPTVTLAAEKAIYQGIHLSHIALTATDIRINLGQVMRRKPLRLLEAFPVTGDVRVTLDDLNASLQSPLLGEGIYQFLRLIAKSQPDDTALTGLLAQFPTASIHPLYRAIASIEDATIQLRLQPEAHQTVPAIAIATQLAVREGNQLCLENPRWLATTASDTAITLNALHGFVINLGAAVTLTECRIQTDHLALAGTIRVLPSEPPAPSASSTT